MATTMFAEVSIYGADVDPDHISGVLGLPADAGWRKGDPKGPRGGPARRKEGCWKIVTDRSTGCEMGLSDHLKCLLERLAPVADVFRSLGEVHHVEFSCVLHLDDEVPALDVPSELLKAIAMYHGGLDIDGYLWAE